MTQELIEKPNWKTLVVEDNDVMRDAIRCLATQFIGDTDECSDGDDAIAIFEDAMKQGEPYDLILLDIEMPRVEGTDVIEQIRKYEAEANIPESDRVRIVFVTGYPDEEHIKEWFTDKHDAYLVKPISKDKLMETIANLRS